MIIIKMVLYELGDPYLTMILHTMFAQFWNTDYVFSVL